MKFLEMRELGRLSSLLTDCVLGDQTLNGRIEAYSCKKAGDDKKLSKQLQQKFKRRKRSGTFTLLAGAAAAGSGGGATACGKWSDARIHSRFLTLCSIAVQLLLYSSCQT